MADEVADSAPAPAAETPEPSPTDTASLAEHEAVFGPPDPTLEGEAKVKNEEARAKVRHRAKSQEAGAGDVGRIGELTKKLRAAEAERDALKARTSQAVPSSPAPSAPTPPDRPSPAAPSPRPSQQASAINWNKVDPDTGLPDGWVPTRPEPSEDEVGTKYPTYAAMTRAQAFWAQQQLLAAHQLYSQLQQQAQQQSQVQQEYHTALQQTLERVDAFKATHPDYEALIQQHGHVNLPPAVNKAIMHAENGPAWVYHLMQHPDQLTEMLLLFDGKPPSDEFVAHATRWLTARAQAASTGSAAPPPPLTLAARPPNPVRTGPSASVAEPPGDDSMSLAEHEKAYGLRRRR